MSRTSTLTAQMLRLEQALNRFGIKPKRAALLEGTAALLGYRTSNALVAAAQDGAIEVPSATVQETLACADGQPLVVVLDPTANQRFALVPDPQARLVTSPYGSVLSVPAHVPPAVSTTPATVFDSILQDLAETAWQDHEFGGHTLTVEASNGWSKDEPKTWTRVFFYRDDLDAPGRDTHRGVFTVRFHAGRLEIEEIHVEKEPVEEAPVATSKVVPEVAPVLAEPWCEALPMVHAGVQIEQWDGRDDAIVLGEVEIDIRGQVMQACTQEDVEVLIGMTERPQDHDDLVRDRLTWETLPHNGPYTIHTIDEEEVYAFLSDFGAQLPAWPQDLSGMTQDHMEALLDLPKWQQAKSYFDRKLEAEQEASVLDACKQALQGLSKASRAKVLQRLG